MRKKMSWLVSIILLTAMLAGCGSSSSGSSSEEASAVTNEESAEETVVGEAEDSYKMETDITTVGYQINDSLNLEEEVTLNIFGPGIFDVGEEGVTDLTSNIFKPGYNEIIERWNELYPNVTLNIEVASWDSWQSAITTACLSGDIDVIMHGASMTDLTEDLTPYVDADPEYREQIYGTASRRTTEHPDEYKVSGISLTLSPMLVFLDSDIFEHYGVELPESNWTYEDVIQLAEQLTGTDPVTGEQTYGLQMFAAGTSNLWFNHVQTAQSLGAKIYEYGPTLADCKVNYMTPESIGGYQLIADMSLYCSPESKEGIAVSTALDGENDWAMLFMDAPIAGYFQMQTAGLEGRYVPISMPICTAGEYEGIPTPYGGDSNMAIYKDSDKKEWAWEFIKFMTTDEVAVQWVASGLNIPNNKDGKQYVQEFVGEELSQVIDYALSSLPENYNNATNDVFNNVSFGSTTNMQITAVDNVINGVMTAEEAAQSMQDYVDEYLSTIN